MSKKISAVKKAAAPAPKPAPVSRPAIKAVKPAPAKKVVIKDAPVNILQAQTSKAYNDILNAIAGVKR